MVVLEESRTTVNPLDYPEVFVFLAGFFTMATSGDALIAKTSEQQDFLYSALCCSFNACSKDIAICVAAEQELW